MNKGFFINRNRFKRSTHNESFTYFVIFKGHSASGNFSTKAVLQWWCEDKCYKILMRSILAQSSIVKLQALCCQTVTFLLNITTQNFYLKTECEIVVFQICQNQMFLTIQLLKILFLRAKESSKILRVRKVWGIWDPQTILNKVFHTNLTG